VGGDAFLDGFGRVGHGGRGIEECVRGRKYIKIQLWRDGAGWVRWREVKVD